MLNKPGYTASLSTACLFPVPWFLQHMEERELVIVLGVAAAAVVMEIKSSSNPYVGMFLLQNFLSQPDQDILKTRSSLVAQWVKDPALSLQWLQSRLWLSFEPWPGNFHMTVQPKRKIRIFCQLSFCLFYEIQQFYYFGFFVFYL